MKLKCVIVVCMLAIVIKSYSQDSLKKEILLPIVKEFSVNNTKIDSYEKLPEFIRYYLEHQRFEFKFTKGRFNGTDMGTGPKRKLFYIVKNADNYIMSYAHGGMVR